MIVGKQKAWSSLSLALFVLGVGASQANSQGLTPLASGEVEPSSSTTIARANPQPGRTTRIAVLEEITLTDDGVIISVDGSPVSAKPNLKIDGDRISITLQGVKLAPSISIQSQNTLPEASLLKRRLKIRQVERGVVEISLSAGQQEWSVTLHNRGLFLVPTAIAQGQSSPKEAIIATSSEIMESKPVAMENEPQRKFIAQQPQLQSNPAGSFQETESLAPPEIASSDLSKPPLLTPQFSSEMPPPTLEELREQLLIPSVTAEKLARTYPPTLTFGVPSAFGPGWGDLYISGTGATAGKDRGGEVDGNISMGFGLGDPVENVGLNFAYNIVSIRNFGQNGTFDMSASRIVYGDPITSVAVAAGWSDFARYGNDTVEDSTVWGTVTSYSLLRPDDPVNKLPLLLSLGIGGGFFRQDPASTGVFGGVGLQIAPQVGVGLQWSGVGLNLGLSYVPIPTIPLTLTATGADLTDNSPGGTRFVFSLSYGFNFLPTPGGVR